jgi:hypothetical protein
MAGSARRLGADPDDLQRLAASFDRAARTLADAAGRVDRALERSGWHGPAAAVFSRRWATDRAVVRSATQRCTAAATELRRQTEQQRTAARSDRPGRTAAPRLSRSESFLRFGGFVDVGPLEGRRSVQARVEELDGARSRVTVSDVVGVAGVAAVGATVEAGCGATTATPVHPLRAEAEVSVGAEVEHRTLWEVADDDVHGLLAAEGAQRAAATLVPGLGPLAAAAARQFEPEPAGHEVLLRATVSAGAVSPRLGRLGPGLSAHAATAVAVGLATATGGRSSLVVEASDEAAASLQAGFLTAAGLSSRRAGTASWVRMDLPLDRTGDGGRPVRLELRSTSTAGTVDRVVVHARLSDDAAVRATTEQVRRDLAAGRAPSRTALDALVAGVRGSLIGPVVRADQLEAATLGCSARSVGGTGVKVGGGGGAQVVNLRPRR